MKTTKQQRDQLRDLYNNATQGVWETGLCKDGIYADKYCLVKANKKEIVGVRQIGRPQHHDKTEENAKLIVEMHNVILDLLDDLENKQDKTTKKGGFKMTNKWISVKDKLPQNGEHVLACFDDGFITGVSYEDDWELWADSGEVVAWMPMPEPYTK